MSMDPLTAPSEVLRRAIRRDGRHLIAIAAAAGIDPGILSRFMRGLRSPTLDTVDAVCRALGVQCRLVRLRKGER